MQDGRIIYNYSVEFVSDEPLDIENGININSITPIRETNSPSYIADDPVIITDNEEQFSNKTMIKRKKKTKRKMENPPKMVLTNPVQLLEVNERT